MSVVSESVLIDVFDMLIKRIDQIQDTITKMNTYLVNEARFKTNNIISGSIFDYPFEIENYKFDKKRYAYISIQFQPDRDVVTLYDLLWSVWDESYIKSELTYQQMKIRENLRQFLRELFDESMLEKIETGIKSYLSDERNEHYMSCNTYEIETLYDHLPEYIINEFITKKEKISFFKSFNHIDNVLSINFVHPHKTMFVDELIHQVLKVLHEYGYRDSDIQNVKIVGLDFFLHTLLSYYDMNGECSSKSEQRRQVTEYVSQLCHCTRDRIRNTLLEHGNENHILPFFSSIEDVAFLLDVLESDHLEHQLLMQM
jgi:hypothetical protein